MLKKTIAALIFTSAALILSACSGKIDLDDVTGYWYLDRSSTCIVGGDWDQDGLLDDVDGFSVVQCTPEVLREIEASRALR